MKLSVFYNQFDINVLHYFDFTEYFVLFIDDLYTYLIIGFILFLLLYIPLGIHIINENTDHYISLLEKNFFQRLISYVKRNYFIIILAIIYYIKPTDKSNSFIIQLTFITIVSIFIKEWMIKEYKVNKRIINPIIHNFITFFVIANLTISSLAKDEAINIKINCTNKLNYLVTESNDTIEMNSHQIYIGKSKQYLFVYNQITNAPIIYPERFIRTLVFNNPKVPNSSLKAN